MKAVQRILSILLAVMVLALPSRSALAASDPATYTFDVSEGDIAISSAGSGQLTVTYGAGATATFGAEQMITLIGSSPAFGVVVNNGATAHVTISSLTLTSAFQIAIGATVELTLVGVSNLGGGLRVPLGANLTITPESTGTLTALGSGDSAAIGGGYLQAGGAIRIYGGTVNATTSGKGAGIGGGTGRSGGYITIGGGQVNVSTADYTRGAGIGGGDGNVGGEITITGGKVTVSTGSNSYGAGIGGASGGAGGTIKISGGEVNSTTNGRGAAIGGGCFKPGGNITISSGTVNAVSNAYGAAIGGGGDQDPGGTIQISGGNVTVTANGTGAGIGGGVNGDGGTITINNATVSATANSSGAAIGGGCFKAGGNIAINGGDVDVVTHNTGAGIGGGQQGAGGTIAISGGSVTVTLDADSDAAGIGGGYQAAGGNIGVSGGDVVVTAMDKSTGAGIGSGPDGTGGNITISGGNVVATAATGSLGAGIGGGMGSDGGNIMVDGGTVSATADSGAGIGGGAGSSGSGGMIAIIAGTVDATANGGGAGIGGGLNGEGGSITVNGGTINATSSNGGAAIGGGELGAGGSTAIAGGTVNATSSGGGTSIGGGSGAAGGTIAISGGVVYTAYGWPLTSGIGDAYGAAGCTIDIGNAIVFDKASGQAYGSAVVRQNTAILAGKTLTIGSAASVAIESGVTLTNDGTIINSGSVNGAGAVQNNGLIVNTGTFSATVAGNPVRAPLIASMVQGIAPLTYTGSAVTPSVTVVDGATTLELGRDYQVAYTNNVGAGTASVTVTGIGLYVYDVAKSFSILKADPVFTVPEYLTATYGQTLAAVTLPGNFSWGRPLGTSVGNAGSNSFPATYTPGDTANFNTKTGISVTITVRKASPSFTPPGPLTAVYGQTLANVALPPGFSWEGEANTPVGGVGGNGFTVTYTPEDTANFNTKTGIPVTIAVGKATPTVTLTGTVGVLVSDTATLTATVTGAAGQHPDGNVTFKRGTDVLGTVTLVDGVADYAWSSVPAGSYTLTAEYGGSADYLAAAVTLVGYDVSKRTQAPLVITGVPAPLIYGDSGFTLSVSGGSGTGDLSCEVTSGSAIEMDEATGSITIISAGQAVVTAEKAGDDLYNPATVSKTIVVEKAVPVITVAPVAFGIEGGSPLSSSTLTGGAAVDAGGTELTGVFVWSEPARVATHSGKYEITFSPDNSTNYAIVTALVSVSVTPSASDSDRVGAMVGIQPETEPGQPTTAQLSVSPTVDATGHATVAIPEGLITDAIARAVADATARGSTGSGIAVALDISLPDTAESLGIVLPQAALRNLADAGVRQLEFANSLVTLCLDREAISEIRSQSAGDVTVTIRPVRDLPQSARGIIGARPVYDITISYVIDGQTANITSLGNGQTTLSIPYRVNEHEPAGYLFGVYVDSDGNAIRIDGSGYDSNDSSIVFSSGHLSIYGVGYTAPSEKYADTASHWAKESIDYVVGRGLFGGTADITFSPDAPMSRGMLVTVLGRLANADVSPFTISSFADVAKGTYYLPYIEWAYNKGIVRGTGGGSFSPDRSVTREEIAGILQNFAKATGYDLPVTRDAVDFTDSGLISSYFQEAATALQRAGVLTGKGDGQFDPKGSASRAEVATMLHRYIDLTIDPATAHGWAKNGSDQWMYYRGGQALTLWQTINGKIYWFDSGGVAHRDAWMKDDFGAWSYLTSDGSAAVDTWLEIDGEWYYFYVDGSLAINTTIDGYRVDENGMRVAK